jgi:hypothetical protein
MTHRSLTRPLILSCYILCLYHAYVLIFMLQLYHMLELLELLFKMLMLKVNTHKRTQYCNVQLSKWMIHVVTKLRIVILWACERELVNKMEYFLASFDDVDGICQEYYFPHWIKYLVMWYNSMSHVYIWTNNKWTFGWKNMNNLICWRSLHIIVLWTRI